MSFDWSAMNHLHEKGPISDPESNTRTVILTDMGRE